MRNEREKDSENVFERKKEKENYLSSFCCMNHLLTAVIITIKTHGLV